MYNIHDRPLALNLLRIEQIRVCSLDLLLVVNDYLTETTTRVNLVNDSGELGNDSLTLRLAGFEELDNTEKTTNLLFSNLQKLLHLALLLTLLAFAISTKRDLTLFLIFKEDLEVLVSLTADVSHTGQLVGRCNASGVEGSHR